jgi:homocysteine S-methyltransferase
VAGLNKGIDCNGLPLAVRTSFFAGARFNPGAADLDAEIARTLRKIRAGAQFLISRPVHELDGLRQVMAGIAGTGVPVLISVVPLRSFEQADYLSHEVPDVRIPGAALSALEEAGPHAAQAGVEMAAALLAEAGPLVQGAVLGLPADNEAAVGTLLGALP